MASTQAPIPPDQFATAISDLELDQLYAEVSRLQNSIYHLERSNIALEEFRSDPDCRAAIEENEVTVVRQKQRVSILLSEVESRGFGTTACGDAAPKTNGVNGVNGGANGVNGNGVNGVDGHSEEEESGERVEVEVRNGGPNGASSSPGAGNRNDEMDRNGDGSGGVYL